MATLKRKAPAHTNRQHDINSPSSLSRRAACPGSAQAEDGLPEETSAAADEGTRQHEILQAYVEEKKRGIDLVLIGEEELISEIDALVSQIIDWHNDTVLTETRVDLSHLGIVAGGICDLIIIRANGALEVWDYKSGRYPVRPAGNLQMLAYLSGAVRLPDAHNDGGMLVGIIQRNIGATACEVTQDELDEAEEQIIRIVDATKQQDAPRNPGDHCKFCRARGVCYAIHETSAELQRTAPASLAETLTALDDVALATFADKLSAVESWCKAAREAFNSQILGGREVVGYRVAAGPSRRAWRDGAEHAVMEICGEHEVDPLVLASPAQVEKMLPKDARAALEQYIEKTPGAAYVKKEA